MRDFSFFPRFEMAKAVSYINGNYSDLCRVELK